MTATAAARADCSSATPTGTDSAGPRAHAGSACATATGPCLMASATTATAVGVGYMLAAARTPVAGTLTVAGTFPEVATAAARIEHPLTTATTEVQLLPAARPIAGALAMFNTWLPSVADVVAPDRPIDDDIVSAPIDSATPIPTARRPAPKRVTGAECNAGRDDP
jgi:hypothetical protein